MNKIFNLIFVIRILIKGGGGGAGVVSFLMTKKICAEGRRIVELMPSYFSMGDPESMNLSGIQYFLPLNFYSC